MTFRLEFYRTARGDEPVLEYIRAQVKRHRATIGRALRNLEGLGNAARRPMVDYLGNDLYELRIPIDGHQHRVLYFFHARSLIVLTSAFLKNEEKVPQEDLTRAWRRRRDWIDRLAEGV